MTSREKFEAWAKDNGMSLVYGDCDYVYSPTVWAWKSWQAAEADMAVQLANSESKCRELVAENVGLKVKGREVLKEAAYVYSHYNRMVDHLDGESIDGQTLHEFQAVIEAETPATDAFLAEVRAQGVDALAQTLEGLVAVSVTRSYITEFAAQLRKGAAL